MSTERRVDVSKRFIACESDGTLVAVDAIDSIEADVHGIAPGFAEGRITLHLRNGDEVVYWEKRNWQPVEDPDELNSQIWQSIRTPAEELFMKLRKQNSVLPSGTDRDLANAMVGAV